MPRIRRASRRSHKSRRLTHSRRGRLVKGSAEAKSYMAHIRAMRHRR